VDGHIKKFITFYIVQGYKSKTHRKKTCCQCIPPRCDNEIIGTEFRHQNLNQPTLSDSTIEAIKQLTAFTLTGDLSQALDKKTE
jgi:hypothetical protein